MMVIIVMIMLIMIWLFWLWYKLHNDYTSNSCYYDDYYYGDYDDTVDGQAIMHQLVTIGELATVKHCK
jgi:hypothetical protein